MSWSFDVYAVLATFLVVDVFWSWLSSFAWRHSRRSFTCFANFSYIFFVDGGETVVQPNNNEDKQQGFVLKYAVWYLSRNSKKKNTMSINQIM